MKLHFFSSNFIRWLEVLYSCMYQGIIILSGIRVKQHYRYKVIPVFYNKYRLTATQQVSCEITAILCLLITLVGIPLFCRFYVFEADVKLIYLDDIEDYQREIYSGTILQVRGWSYRGKLDYQSLVPVNSTNNIELEKSNEGYWIFWDKKSDTTTENHITLSDFQFWWRHDVALALRYYTHDLATLTVNFEGSDGSNHSTVLNSVGKRRSKNFNNLCTLFILPPFIGHVDKIHISGHTTLNSFIVIDKILLAVGNDNRGLHMLFTLVPQGWCFNVAGNNVITSNTLSSKASTKYIF